MSSSGRGRGFNAAKKGTGQVGFQPAPLVGAEAPTAADSYARSLWPAPEDESVVDALEEQYERFTALLGDEPEAGLDGLTPEEQAVVQRSRLALDESPRRLVASSPETARTVKYLSREWGLSEEEEREALVAVDAAAEPDDPTDFEYVNGAEAAEELRMLAQGAPFHDSAPSGGVVELVEQVRAGEVLLSRRELDGLARFRGEAHRVFAANREEAEQDRLGAEWVPAVVDRRCELCGQFISTRDAHGSMYVPALPRSSSGARADYESQLSVACRGIRDKQWAFREVVSELTTGRDYKRRLVEVKDEGDFVPGRAPTHPLTLLKLDKDDVFAEGFSVEMLEDLYMAGDDARTSVVSVFAEKQGFLPRRLVVALPENIRNAVLEAPPTGVSAGHNTAMMVLAARIEPPFNEYEIKRLIDRGDKSVLATLLAVQRTRDAAARIAADYPSEALRQASLVPGLLDSDVVARMASSGDPLVRAYAAGSPDLTEDDAVRLSEDPDLMVRRALAVPHWVPTAPGERLPVKPNMYSALSRFKAIGATLMNDSDSEIAVAAFLRFHKRAQDSRRLSLETSGYRDDPPPANFTTEQKFLISKIRSRERFNEIKKHVMDEQYGYDLSHPDVMRFLAR